MNAHYSTSYIVILELFFLFRREYQTFSHKKNLMHQIIIRPKNRTMKISQILSLIAVASYWDASHAVKGTIGYGDRNDICSDADGNLLCYDPKGSWPLGTDECDSWDTSTGECSFGNIAGNIGGGLDSLEEEIAVLAPTPTPKSSFSFLRGNW
mmetsp:Transcript_24776/g.37658  ORF Transcript_24776/g.37658 Transcript_24776/m.37658 type:complete len:153 (+) Transcript_24776:303-761(+)